MRGTSIAICSGSHAVSDANSRWSSSTAASNSARLRCSPMKLHAMSSKSCFGAETELACDMFEPLTLVHGVLQIKPDTGEVIVSAAEFLYAKYYRTQPARSPLRAYAVAAASRFKRTP